MKKSLSLVCLIALQTIFSVVCAATWPQVSTTDNEHWYFIQFTSGGNVIADQGNGSQALTAAMANSDAQMWKLSGDNTSGYTITNKLGRTMYLNSTAQNSGFLSTSTTATSNYTFVLKENAAGTAFLMAPKGNTSVYLNQWQGAGSGKRIGLWNDANDTGSMLQFVEADIEVGSVIPLIPYPASLTKGDGRLNFNTLTSIGCADNETLPLLQDFAAQLKATSGILLTVATTAPATGSITVTFDNALPTEGYKLDITADGIAITAAGKTGVFYALQTVKQLLPYQLHGKTLASDADWSVPCLSIADQPKFEYRGFMIDVARHFFTKEEMKSVIDIMALYKMNRLHWHLTDDQGWRIEIPEYPKLTEVGAIRAGSNTSSGQSTTFYDDTEYGRGCFFTLDDIREIVAYAKERYIEILPEIDMPGHMVAALASYPELSCDPQRTYEVRIDGGISQDVLDISNPDVITFLKTVLGHVAEVFPYEYIHIGGDECPTTCWQNSATCQQMATNLGISIAELQGWLVEELGEWLRDNYGKGIVVWDELLGRWPTTNAVKPVIMAWNNISYTATAANKGYSSIATPYQNVYFDFMQAAPADCDVNEEYFGGWSETNTNTLSDVYNLNPVSSVAGKEQFVLGTQGNLWAETLCNIRQLQYQMLPRLLALSEVAWLENSKKNWLSFLARMQSHDEIFDANGWIYAKHHFDAATLSAAETALKEAKEIILQTLPGCAGYVSQDTYDNLVNAYNALLGDSEDAGKLTALQTAIENTKSASIVQPDPSKTYQIVSASSYYKAKYEGSTVYVKDASLRFHYTPQLEPEELWRFETNGTGYTMRNVLTEKMLNMPSYNANATADDSGISIRIDKATVANGAYSYVPGSVTVSAVSGYTASATGSVKRMFADATGYVKAYNSPALCGQGTWRLQEVTDYTAMLQALVHKCELIIIKGEDGHDGTPTESALGFLQSSLVEPASGLSSCDAETYYMYMDIYNQYLSMPRKSFIDTLSEGVYYRIHNAYSGWANRYAVANSSGEVAPSTTTSGDGALWRITKNSNGTVFLYNKLSEKAAYVASSAQDQAVKVGDTAMEWKLEEFSSDESSGILIRTGDFSWYTNPNAWNYILLKPYQWGACVWVFEPTTVETGIHSTKSATTASKHYFDLQGRPVSPSHQGVVITPDGRKFIQ